MAKDAGAAEAAALPPRIDHGQERGQGGRRPAAAAVSGAPLEDAVDSGRQRAWPAVPHERNRVAPGDDASPGSQSTGWNSAKSRSSTGQTRRQTASWLM